MIEGSALPEPGAIVQLSRGTLMVDAIVVWSTQNRRGMRFLRLIDVHHWRSNGRNVQQRRVDDVVQVFKTQENHASSDTVIDELQRPKLNWTEDDFVQDLRRAGDLLSHLEDVLTDDPIIIDRHGAALQNLDIVRQVLAAMVDLKTAHCSVEDGSSKLVGLRLSADQALWQRSN